MGKAMYCEKCGQIYWVYFIKKCNFCGNRMKPLQEELKYKYHLFVEDWSSTSYEEELSRKESFVMSELKDNPFFSIEEYQKQVQKHIQINQGIDEYHKRKLEEKRLKNLEKNLKGIIADSDKQNYAPKCPICGSTNINKITLTSRAVKTATFGVVGAVDDAGKTYKCSNCGSKF